LTDKHIAADPRENPYFNWGFVAFTVGLMHFTILPLMAHKQFIFPPEAFFSVPGAIFLFLAIFLWVISADTYIHQVLATGGGFIYFGTFQAVLALGAKNYQYILIYALIVIIGIFYILSAWDAEKRKTRPGLIMVAFVPANIFSIILLTYVLLGI
jgi:hypothetical protein